MAARDKGRLCCLCCCCCCCCARWDGGGGKPRKALAAARFSPATFFLDFSLPITLTPQQRSLHPLSAHASCSCAGWEKKRKRSAACAIARVGKSRLDLEVFKKGKTRDGRRGWTRETTEGENSVHSQVPSLHLSEKQRGISRTNNLISFFLRASKVANRALLFQPLLVRQLFPALADSAMTFLLETSAEAISVQTAVAHFNDLKLVLLSGENSNKTQSQKIRQKATHTKHML